MASLRRPPHAFDLRARGARLLGNDRHDNHCDLWRRGEQGKHGADLVVEVDCGAARRHGPWRHPSQCGRGGRTDPAFSDDLVFLFEISGPRRLDPKRCAGICSVDQAVKNATFCSESADARMSLACICAF
ncbi:hypothetical protein EJB05_01704 [Eragrostis curvula]|uniref:Uncharacterized protein n=1 Tax=Eragrostis curvula TaxID=38414 RepID=A0A5J9WQW0_9POAL|nr:hypothetical protein EJB05_01704 [Eragrostis curvula]